MSKNIVFQQYRPQDEALCLQLFDDNCPTYFAENERADYQAFLNENPAGYYVAFDGDIIAAAFGLKVDAQSKRGCINWIMVSPASHGGGVGRQMMNRAKALAQAQGSTIIDIAASHLSAPFFARFGAKELNYIEHGWGPDMHRIDMEWPLV